MSIRQLEIESLIKHLGEEILPQGARLLLFGSQARDEARPDSDWDLLILLEGEKVSNEDFDRWVMKISTVGCFRSFHWDGRLVSTSILWLTLTMNG